MDGCKDESWIPTVLSYNHVESTSSQSKKTKEYQKAEQTLTNEEITYTHKEQSSVTSSSTLTYNEPPLDEEISPAREVEEYNEKNVYFTRSSTPRNHRPLNVMYSVGQVIKHIYDGYFGVIIGWDTQCKVRSNLFIKGWWKCPFNGDVPFFKGH